MKERSFRSSLTLHEKCPPKKKITNSAKVCKPMRIMYVTYCGIISEDAQNTSNGILVQMLLKNVSGKIHVIFFNS